jgi:hypothetical protein
MTIPEEDRILFDYLSEKQKSIDSDYDALDTKFSQIIALNGLILSIILFSADKAKSLGFFGFGLSLIFISICLGIFGYSPKEYEDGLDYFCPNKMPMKKLIIPPELGDIKKFNKSLLNCIIGNMNIHDRKAKVFDFVLYFLLCGLFFVIMGYYL